jgi:hypothetical protein
MGLMSSARTIIFLCLLCVTAHAQTSPAFDPGKPICANYPSAQCPAPANPFSLNQAFQNKADYPISSTGGSPRPLTVAPGANGVWLSGGVPDIKYTPVTGGGNTLFAQELLQYTSVSDKTNATLGMAFNATYQTGYSSNPSDFYNFGNSLNLAAFVQAGAGHVWGIANDLVIDASYGAAPNNINNFAINTELDVTNNGWDSVVASPIGAVANLYLAGITGNYPIFSEIWVSPFQNSIATATFLGTISGTGLTFSSNTGTVIAGQAVTGVGVTAGTFIVSGSGLSWTVNLSQSVGPVAMSTYSYGAHYGMFVSNNLSIKDSTIFDGSYSTTSYQDNGTHAVGIDLSNATYRIDAINLAAGQNIAFGGGYAVNAAGGFWEVLYGGATKFYVDSAGDAIAKNSLIAQGTAATVSAGQISYSGATVANTFCGTLAGSAGCLVINVAGVTRYVPFF